MTHESSHSDELLGLLSGLVDDILTDADVERLRALLRDDPRAQDLYLKYMGVHAQLHLDEDQDNTSRPGKSTRSLKVTLARFRQKLMQSITRHWRGDHLYKLAFAFTTLFRARWITTKRKTLQEL